MVGFESTPRHLGGTHGASQQCRPEGTVRATLPRASSEATSKQPEGNVRNPATVSPSRAGSGDIADGEFRSNAGTATRWWGDTAVDMGDWTACRRWPAKASRSFVFRPSPSTKRSRCSIIVNCHLRPTSGLLPAYFRPTSGSSPCNFCVCVFRSDLMVFLSFFPLRCLRHVMSNLLVGVGLALGVWRAGLGVGMRGRVDGSSGCGWGCWASA